MASHYERRQQDKQLHSHIARSKGLINRVRHGERLQEAATEHWYIAPGTRSPAIQPMGAGELDQSKHNLRRHEEEPPGKLASLPEGTALRAAMMNVPKAAKDQAVVDEAKKALRKKRWAALVGVTRVQVPKSASRAARLCSRHSPPH